MPAQPADASGALPAEVSPDAMQDERSAGHTGRRFARLGRLRGQFRRYASALWWVACDALPRSKARVTAIVVCNIIGLAAAGAAVGGVMSYARAAERGRPVRILGHGFHIGSDLRSLLLFGAAIAALGVLSAACTYFTDRLIIVLAREYHALCAERALMIAADPLCRGWQAIDDRPPRMIISRLAGSASRAMGLVLRDMLRIILPTLTVLAAAGFLFYIDARLTLLLIPAAVVYLIPLYVINRRVTSLQCAYRELSPRARGEVGRRLREMMNTGRLEQGIDELRREAINGPSYRGTLAALYGRLLADRRVHLLNSAFFVACLVAVLIGFGMEARGGARAWSDLLFYFFALRFAISSLKQTTTLGAKFSRFFPEYRAYAAFVKESEQARQRRQIELANPHPLPEAITLRLGRGARWDSSRTLRVTAGDIVCVLLPQVSGHADLEGVAVRLERRVDEGVDLATRAVFAAVPDAIEAAIADRQASAVFITGEIALRPRGELWLTLERRGDRRIAFIVHDDVAAMLASPIAQTRPGPRAVVMDGARVVAGGDVEWLRAHHDAIAAFLHEQAELARHHGAADDAVDDDEDEDSEE